MADQQLHIFHLERTDSAKYGEYTDFVVIAEHELEARLLAGWSAGGDSIVWADPSKTEVKHLGNALDGLDAQIVLGNKLGE